MIQRRLAAVVAIALVVAGCGGGSDEDGGALAQAIADRMMSEAGTDAAFTQQEAECFGTEVVDRVGVDRLDELGLGIEDIESGADPSSVDLSSEDITDMTDSLAACVDFGELVVSQALGGAEISDESAQCLADGINDGDLISTFAESAFLGQEIDPAAEQELTTAMFSLFTQCLTAEEFMSLGSG